MNQSSDSSASNLFRPVTPSRIYERVADAIQRAIIQGQFPPGTILPPERTLAQRFQVTRNTVREALRSLETAGLISIRQGSGVKVLDYLATAGLELLTILLRSDAAGQEKLLGDIMAARTIIGKAICAHSIDQLDQNALEGMREVIEKFVWETKQSSPDMNRLQELDFEIQNRLIHAGGNQAFILLHNSLRRIYERIAYIFEPLFVKAPELARLYLKAIEDLESDNQEGAKQTFALIFEAGKVAMSQNGLLEDRKNKR